MSELNDLYQEVILDHNKNPRNFREIETANFKADGHNPLCGDQLKIFLVHTFSITGLSKIVKLYSPI